MKSTTQSKKIMKIDTIRNVDKQKMRVNVVVIAVIVMKNLQKKKLL